MRRAGLSVLLAWLAAFPLYAELRNQMPSPRLEHFKAEANRKAHLFPQTYILQGDEHKKELYLTFDDGPDRRNTPKILDILKTEGVKATFFFLGEQIKRFPAVAARAHSEGHLILPHGLSHVDFRKRSIEALIKEQVLPAAKAVASVTGKEPKAFRPPYGAVTDAQIKALRLAGYRVINWSVDSFDWMRGRTSEQIVSEVEHFVHPGAIILLHSGPANSNTPEALRRLIRRLKDAGYGFGRIDTIY